MRTAGASQAGGLLSPEDVERGPWPPCDNCGRLWRLLSPVECGERASKGRRETETPPVRNVTKETPLAGAATLAFDPENFGTFSELEHKHFGLILGLLGHR